MTRSGGLVGIVLALAFVACTYANGVNEIDGRWFPVERVSTLHRGMTEAEVRTILGDPFEVQGPEGDSSWRYYYKRQQKATKRILGIFPVVTLGETWSRETVVIFRDRVVESVKNESRT